LHTSAYTPNTDPAGDDFFNDATNELSGGGYAQQTLGTKSIGFDSATNHVNLIAANTTFSSLTATFRYIVVYKDTGSTATSPLLGVVDTLGQTVSATNYVVDWDDVEGILALSVA